ncbi:hypothetical protein AeMF1_020265 [Aphanomyces euteiches]|nr:hypothetical protein AeMF1_020265 [Aphanomyces euteiches]KAH9190787.1 hypothetical protein AeNC1_007236 [Aphanomyces euteiches]
MNPHGLLVLSLAIATNALLTLTTCNKPNGTVVACLNDTIAGTTTDLASSRSGYYDFTNLGISSIQSWPLDAQSINLAFNKISAISTPLPVSLASLNLSHNALQKNWLQTPITVRSLDVSYNQGGLPWLENILWGLFLPCLTQLAFRGNQVAEFNLTYENFPMFPLSTLDFSENSNLALSIDASVNSCVNQVEFTLYLSGARDFSAANAACAEYASYVVMLKSWKIQYFSQSWAVDRSSWKAFYACCKYCRLPSSASIPRASSYTLPPWYDEALYVTPKEASRGRFLLNAFIIVGICILVVATAYYIRKYRGTICSSKRSDPPRNQIDFVPPPSTPRLA